jgi:hypothetical protein
MAHCKHICHMWELDGFEYHVATGLSDCHQIAWWHWTRRNGSSACWTLLTSLAFCSVMACFCYSVIPPAGSEQHVSTSVRFSTPAHAGGNDNRSSQTRQYYLINTDANGSSAVPQYNVPAIICCCQPAWVFGCTAGMYCPLRRNLMATSDQDSSN